MKIIKFETSKSGNWLNMLKSGIEHKDVSAVILDVTDVSKQFAMTDVDSYSTKDNSVTLSNIFARKIIGNLFLLNTDFTKEFVHYTFDNPNDALISNRIKLETPKYGLISNRIKLGTPKYGLMRYNIHEEDRTTTLMYDKLIARYYMEGVDNFIVEGLKYSIDKKNIIKPRYKSKNKRYNEHPFSKFKGLYSLAKFNKGFFDKYDEVNTISYSRVTSIEKF